MRDLIHAMKFKSIAGPFDNSVYGSNNILNESPQYPTYCYSGIKYPEMENIRVGFLTRVLGLKAEICNNRKWKRFSLMNKWFLWQASSQLHHHDHVLFSHAKRKDDTKTDIVV